MELMLATLQILLAPLEQLFVPLERSINEDLYQARDVLAKSDVLQGIIEKFKKALKTQKAILVGYYEQIKELEKKIKELEKEVEEVKQTTSEKEEEVNETKERVNELERQLKQDSKNSSKPPSSDKRSKKRYPKRERSKRKAGGQKGHKGHTLEMSDKPDKVVRHEVKECKGCGANLEKTSLIGKEKRQVYEIPPIKIEITEHQAEIKCCPECEKITRGIFPGEVKQKAQYGSRIKAMGSYFNQYQLIPYERCQEMFMDLLGHCPSQGSLVKYVKDCYQKLEKTEEKIKASLLKQGVLHFDETGCHSQGKRKWLHVVSTDKLTYYAIDKQRGKAAMDRMKILPKYKGIAVHDGYASYWQYECEHAACNAHYLREIRAVVEEERKQGWGKEMVKLLKDIKGEVETEKENDPEATKLSVKRQKEYERKYQKILDRGLKANGPPSKKKETESKKAKRGKKKQSRAKNLLDRMDTHREEILLFMRDFSVPFDNNQAERDIRMMKVKQKISGDFRGKGAEHFCRVRGYISTMRKQGINVLESLESVFIDQPLMPAL